MFFRKKNSKVRRLRDSLTQPVGESLGGPVSAKIVPELAQLQKNYMCELICDLKDIIKNHKELQKQFPDDKVLEFFVSQYEYKLQELEKELKELGGNIEDCNCKD